MKLQLTEHKPRDRRNLPERQLRIERPRDCIRRRKYGNASHCEGAEEDGYGNIVDNVAHDIRFEGVEGMGQVGKCRIEDFGCHDVL